MLRRRARHRDPDRARLTALAAAVAVAVGCGDGDASTTATAVEAPLTKAEFIAEADRICVSSDSRLEAAGDDLLTSDRVPKPARVRRVALNIAVPALEAEVRAIGAIGAPPGDEARIERILDATERGIGQIEADPERVIDRPPSALREAARLARAYGSRECGTRVGTSVR